MENEPRAPRIGQPRLAVFDVSTEECVALAVLGVYKPDIAGRICSDGASEEAAGVGFFLKGDVCAKREDLAIVELVYISLLHHEPTLQRGPGVSGNDHVVKCAFIGLAWAS